MGIQNKETLFRTRKQVFCSEHGKNTHKYPCVFLKVKSQNSKGLAKRFMS